MAILENSLLPKYSKQLLFYKRFIDDVIGIWLDTENSAMEWDRFKEDINDPRFELQWEISELSNTVDYMDLTISICKQKDCDDALQKKNNLHLYIPPKSCHPPGLLTGMVHGMINRIFTLCSSETDRSSKVLAFFGHLQRRGYEHSKLRPIFKNAIQKHLRPKPTPHTGQRNMNAEKSIFFHIPWHPQNPASFEIQKLWKMTVSEPSNLRPLSEVLNQHGYKTGLSRLIVAYSRALNLGNLLSYRDMSKTDGPPTSAFMD